MNSHLFVHDIVVQGFSGLGVAQKLRGQDVYGGLAVNLFSSTFRLKKGKIMST